jgi:nucleoside-diphosphate-sugar epimerase
MRRYFMTGCTGWIGKSLVAEIAKRPDTEQIVLLTRDAQRSYPFYSIAKNVSLYEGHILKTPFPTGYFTNIIHGANEPLGHGPEGYYVMVEGTRRLLEWSQKLTIRPYILLLSSGGVARDSAYGRGKAMTELLLERHDLLGKVVRIYTLIGPNTPIRYAIGNFIRQAIDYGAVRVVGGQNIWRSYLHVDDAARAIADAVDNGEVLKPVDIGSRQKISIYDAAKLVAEIFGASFDPVAEEHAEDIYLPNVERDFQTISLRQALERIRDETSLRNPVLEPAKAA